MWGMQKCLKSFRRKVLLSLLLQSALSEVSGQYFPVRRRQNTVKFTENESTWILQLKRRVDENLQCRRWANLNNGFRVAAALKTDHCWPDFVICIDDSISITVVRQSVVRQSYVRQSVVRQSVVRQSVVRQTVVRQTVVRQTVVRQTVKRQSIVRQTVVRQTVVRQTVVRQTVVRQTIVWDKLSRDKVLGYKLP
mgnify:CR=1 FL=1